MAVIVDGNRERSRIAELENLNTQARWWRWITTIFLTVFLIGCILVLNSSVRGLSSPGPAQDEFVQTFNQSLQTDTVPELEREASSTLTEIQPEVRTSLMKLRDDVPALSQSAEDQIRILQADLPKKGEAVLDKRFTTMLESKKAKIHEMFPNVTDEQVSSLITTFSDHARTQVTDLSNQLFRAHQAKLQSILASMDKIRKDESTNVKNDQPDWEMGVLLMDVFRDDLQGMTAPAKPQTKSPGGVVMTNGKGAGA